MTTHDVLFRLPDVNGDMYGLFRKSVTILPKNGDEVILDWPFILDKIEAGRGMRVTRAAIVEKVEKAIDGHDIAIALGRSFRGFLATCRWKVPNK